MSAAKEAFSILDGMINSWPTAINSQGKPQPRIVNICQVGDQIMQIAALCRSFRGETRCDTSLTFTLAKDEQRVYECAAAKGLLRMILARLAVLIDEVRFPRENRDLKDKDRGFMESNPYGFEATFNYPVADGSTIPFHTEICNGMPKIKQYSTYFFDIRKLECQNQP
ncbi:MAG: hypothetical protein JO316_06175 [Abitibacteriaceae bacterium]|nr:hypothetical protein [Abditibacteriaceae bacterium]